MYDAPPFKRPPVTANNLQITEAADKALEAGVQFWQVNMKIDEGGVSLSKLFMIEDRY